MLSGIKKGLLAVTVLAVIAGVAVFVLGKRTETRAGTSPEASLPTGPNRTGAFDPEDVGPIDLTVIDPFGFRLGEMVPNLAYTTFDGHSGSLGDFRGTSAIVIVVRDTGCPVSARYAPRLARMEEQYASAGVKFLYLNPGAHESSEEMQSEVNDFGFNGPYIHDPEGRIARGLRIRTTTEVIVLDPALTLVYRGAVDDQYGISYTRPNVQTPWLKEAIDAVLKSELPATRFTEIVPGCALGFDKGEATDEVARSLIPKNGLTYHNRISRILQENCVTCHREGGIAPFRLDSYAQAFGYRQMIEYVLNIGLMPPWFADPEVGHWANDRSLDTAERRALLSWIDNGAPEGDPTLAVHHRHYAEGWTIGEPDAVFQLPEPINIPAEGVIPYQYSFIKTDFPEDRWVRKIEVRPTAPQNTHHAVVTLDAPRGAGRKKQDRWRSGIDGFFAATAPGAVGVDFGEGKAKLLPAGAWLRFQLHYTANGRANIDQSKIGFIFADGPPDIEVETASAFNVRFLIPPGAKNYEVVGRYEFPADGQLERLFPHTHLRGIAFRYDLVDPDGTETPLLVVPRYNFDWQLTYDFEDPVPVRNGSVLRATAWYDNSADNPYNPDPTVEVHHGQQTWDEMMIGYFDWSRTAAEVTARNQLPLD